MYGRINANASGRIGNVTAALRRSAVTACALAAVVTLLDCGGVTGTSNGLVVYAGPNGGTKSSQDLVKDPAEFPLLRATGTGSSEIAAFSAAGVWEAVWAFDCSGNSGLIRILARDSQGSMFTLGSYDGNAHALGQSPTMAAGNYTLFVATGATCNWAVGARPIPHS